MRVPYIASLAESEAHLKHTNPSLYEMFLTWSGTTVSSGDNTSARP